MNGESYCDTSYYKPQQSSLLKPRGALARTILQKQLVDKCLSEFDKNKWYECNFHQLPTRLSSKFIQLEPDEETLKFLEKSEEKSSWIFVQIWHLIVKLILKWFMTQTSINGLLQRGSMFVVSSSQFLKLVRNQDFQRNSMIDLGAGDGGVTSQIAPFFDKTYVTEISKTMKKLLHKKGYEISEIETWDSNKKFDVISCLNLLDRCDTPIQLLKRIKSALKPDGYLFLALVLPFSAYVETGSKCHKPKELLPIVGETFEKQVESVIEDVLVPNGYEVMSWSRVPYLCEGDLGQSYFWLDNAVFVLKSKE